MKWLVGQQTCSSCGATTISLLRPKAAARRLVWRCFQCGEKAGRIPVLFDAARWPHLEPLVEFSEERERMGLPDLTDSYFH